MQNYHKGCAKSLCRKDSGDHVRGNNGSPEHVGWVPHASNHYRRDTPARQSCTYILVKGDMRQGGKGRARVRKTMVKRASSVLITRVCVPRFDLTGGVSGVGTGNVGGGRKWRTWRGVKGTRPS